MRQLDSTPLPPWKQELLNRKDALSRALNLVGDEKKNCIEKEGAGCAKNSVNSDVHKRQRPRASACGVTCVECSPTCDSSRSASSPLSLLKVGQAGGRGRFVPDQSRTKSLATTLVTPCEGSLSDVKSCKTRSRVPINASSTNHGLKVTTSPSVNRNKAGLSSIMGEDQCSRKVADEDSDSSEEIHYGPGFVSKLKSRYMSVALRASSQAGSGLRRTASLEDFLEKDKDEVLIELNQPRRYQQRKSESAAATENGRYSRRTLMTSTHKGVAGGGPVSRKAARETVKRCQSVEVLARNLLPEDGPPPLPPKATNNHHLENVLNSEALANDCVVVEGDDPRPTSRKASGDQTVIASLRKPFHYRRRSAGLLFGVAEKELPAPDTVKETRKIFETRSGYSKPPLIKSRSTSSLYNDNSASNNRASRSRSPVKSNNSSSKSSLVKPALPNKPEHVKYPVTRPQQPPTPEVKTFEVPPLRHVELPTSGRKPQPGVVMTKKLNVEHPEEGIKVVSQDSIDKIRQAAGESFSFNFKNNEEAKNKPYLPQKFASSTNNVKNNDHVDNHVPVGVIKPITRITAVEPAVHKKASSPPLNKRAESPTTTLNNLINLTKLTALNNEDRQQEQQQQRPKKKEVIVLDKKTDLEPILKVTPKNGISPKVVTFAIEDSTKIDDRESPIKDSNSDEGIDNEEDKMMNNNYRDSWKKRQDAEAKNTMVFNFLNSQKVVTHIENDGLDLSKRKKNKQHLQQIAKDSGVVILKNGLDNEDEDEGVDEEESDSDSGLGASVPPCSVTFIGANASTGKSSLRSKPREKKLNITFSDSLTQVFEYPSFDSMAVDSEDASKTAGSGFKSSTGIASKKNSIGSFGGLGSYTPSKMATETPFQLGVSRSVPHSSSTKATTSNSKNANSTQDKSEEVLRPIEDAISWSGSSSSSDMLF